MKTLKRTGSLITCCMEWIENDILLLCVKSLLYIFLHFTISMYFVLL